MRGTLVTAPISFYIDEEGAVFIKTSGISVVPGYRDTYYVGDRLDMTTLLVSINYADGTVVETPILESMCEYDFSKPGKAEVRITVEDMTTSYTVTVLEKEEASTEPVTEPVTEPTTTPAIEPVTDGPVTEPQPDTQPETEAVSTVDVTEPASAEGGCASVVVSALSLVALVAAGMTILLKKKED